MTPPLSALPTPALILDEAVMRRNIERMSARVNALGATLRPHVKTHKSLDIARIVREAGHTRGITVSTLGEAEHFFSGGFKDILYGVALSPDKAARCAALLKAGCTLRAITDSVDTVVLLDREASRLGITLPLLIELDVDGHRSGVQPGGTELRAVAAAIASSRALKLDGVIAHAGASYAATTTAALAAHAHREASLTRQAAKRLRTLDYTCQVVSVGSTPTALTYEDLTGVTEVRAGVYVFFDLVQAGLGVTSRDDIALSVLTTVIGHQPSKGWIITDAGWMAMSRDRGTAEQAVDYGYGQVCDLEGRELRGWILISANQEHGIVASRAGGGIDPALCPVGSRLRIKPNHACATAAQFSDYAVLKADGLARWDRLQTGW